MSDRTGDDVRASYDRVAPEYARRFSDELGHKPLDRQHVSKMTQRQNCGLQRGPCLGI